MTAIEQSLEFLKTRTMLQFKRAHVLQFADGTLLNLDLNVTAANDKALIAAMAEAVKQFSETDTLPAAPVELWTRFVAVGDDPQYRRGFPIQDLPGSRRRIIPAVVRMEHAV